MNYDVFIKAHESDYSKLKFCINSLKHLNPAPKNIYVVSPTGTKPVGTDFDDLIISVKDDDVTPTISKSKIGYRPNWSWSSLITLFQDITENDLYLEVQADSFFIKDIQLFENEKPIIYTTRVNPNNNGAWGPYFNFSNSIFDIDKKTFGRSFITEFLMFNKKHTKVLQEKYPSFEDMMDRVYDSISSDCYSSNQEIFGNLIERDFSEDYVFSHDTPLILEGRESLEPVSEEFLISFIERCKETNAVSCSYHAWSNEK